MATFQVKDFLSIVASMVNSMRASQTTVTDFNVGSVARSMLEAPAAEIDQLYQQMLAGLKQAIPVSVYRSFDFPAKEAQPASGLARVSITTQDSDVLIAAGTRATRDDGACTYLTQEDVIIAAGDSFADVRIVAETEGTLGNLISGTGFTLSPSPAGFQSAVALADFRNGAEAETEPEQKARFNGYVRSLARGTPAALRYGLTTVALTDSAGNVTERVAAALIDEPYLTDPINFPPGQIDIRIFNGVGATSAELVAEAQKVLDGYTAVDGTLVPGWKAAGTKVIVAAAVEELVTVTATVEIADGYESAVVIAAVEAKIGAYILGLGIGAKVLVAALIAAIMAVPGVVNVGLAEPASDVAMSIIDKAMLGALDVHDAADAEVE